MMFDKSWFAPALVAMVGLLLIIACVIPARSQEVTCPREQPRCKIITLSPDEETSLSGNQMIFDYALWANRANFTQLIEQWREKLKNAPAGKPWMPPPPEQPAAPK